MTYQVIHPNADKTARYSWVRAVQVLEQLQKDTKVAGHVFNAGPVEMTAQPVPTGLTARILARQLQTA